MQEAAASAGRSEPLGVVRYMPCCVRADRAEAMLAAKRAVGEMLPVYWGLGQRLEGAKTGAHHGERDHRSGIRRRRPAPARRARTPAPCSMSGSSTAFAIAGTAAECVAAIAACRTAGVTELALTFSGAGAAAEEMKYLQSASAA